jgi:endonuclease/exonuclease/phosphatase family metal-dependent hydrolase
VAAWNIRVNDSSSGHARAVVAALMSMNDRPRIVVMSEARQTMFNTYISEFQSRTGQTWTGVFRSHCPPGKLSGSSCTGSEDEGVAIFTSYPIQSSNSMYFPYGDSWHSARAAIRAAINVNGVIVQVFGVHLIPNNATARYASMSLLKAWAAGYSKPQLVGGDFNADPDQIRSSSGMGSTFLDTALLAGSGGQNTAMVPSPTMKLDYLFTDAGRKANPQWAVVPTSTGGNSDHYPVLANFRVSP